MNRLQKKCFLASAGMHLLLPIILVLGSALTPREKPQEAQVLEFIPMITTDDKVSGGGERVHSAPAEPNRPVVMPPRPPEPQPPKVVERAPDPDPVPDLSESGKRKLPKVSTTPKYRNNPTARPSPKPPKDDSID